MSIFPIGPRLDLPLRGGWTYAFALHNQDVLLAKPTNTDDVDLGWTNALKKGQEGHALPQSSVIFSGCLKIDPPVGDGSRFVEELTRLTGPLAQNEIEKALALLRYRAFQYGVQGPVCFSATGPDAIDILSLTKPHHRWSLFGDTPQGRAACETLYREFFGYRRWHYGQLTTLFHSMLSTNVSSHHQALKDFKIAQGLLKQKGLSKDLL